MFFFILVEYLLENIGGPVYSVVGILVVSLLGVVSFGSVLLYFIVASELAFLVVVVVVAVVV